MKRLINLLGYIGILLIVSGVLYPVGGIKDSSFLLFTAYPGLLLIMLSTISKRRKP